jgi:hypothetical protein
MMRYYKTYNFIAGFSLIVSVCFLVVLFFWPNPQSADAKQVESPVLQKAVTKQTSNDNNCVSAANYVAFESISDEVYSKDSESESFLAQNPPGKDAIVEINSGESGSSVGSASDSLGTESSTTFMQSDSVSSAVASSSNATLSKSGSSGTGGGGSATAGSSGSSGTGGGTAAAGSAGSSGTGSSGSSGSGGANSSGLTGLDNSGDSPVNIGTPVVKQGKYPVIVLSSYQKVLQDEWTVTGDSSADIFCAKNETESFQILVINKSSNTLPDIEIIGSGWQSVGISITKEPVITLYREHYVNVTKSSYLLDSTIGMYPDALIPFVDPYTKKPIYTAKYLANHASVEPQKTQGYWVDVEVGSDVPAGIYRCSLLVTSADTPIAEIPVTLQVWDFTLPKQRQFITWYYGFYNIHQYYGIQQPSGENYNTLYERYCDMAYENGVYPEYQLGGAEYNAKDGTVTFLPGYHSNMRTFIDKYGTGIFQIPPSWLVENYSGTCPVPSNTTKPTAAAAKKTLESFNLLSKTHPEYGQYVVYLDEPWIYKQALAVKKIKDIMNTIPDLRIKMMLTGAQYAFDILDSAGKRCADLWICYGQHIIDEHTRAPGAYRSLENLTSSFLGDSNNPDAVLWTNSTKVYIDANLLSYRDFAWYGYVLGATGGFGWQLSMPSTDAVGDAWVEPRSYINPEAPSRVFNGQGILIYPGNPARVGISGIGGPIATMRLKTWRNACEDFEYFKMLEKLTDKATVNAIVSNVVHDYYTCADPADYAAARKTIAELILKHQK